MASSSSSSPEISSATCVEASSNSYKDASLGEVLDDLSSRFIMNLPDEEIGSLERVCFQVEQAHWFYEDFIREQNIQLPSYPIKKFSHLLFQSCPALRQWSNDHEQAFNTFMQYKTRVPVCGAIMLNDVMDKCVLVKGWKASSGWGFPKGKINEIEPPPTCAIREVLEETGYNLAGQLDPQNVIEVSIKQQKISLFIVPNVSEDFPFKTQTRKEISKIEWFRLSDLPTWKRNKATPGKFYLISPFIGPLKAFINQRENRNVPRKPKKNQPLPMPSANNHPGRPLKSQTRTSATEDTLNSFHQPELSGLAKEMDPHFARLLASLELSAKPDRGNEQLIQEPLVVNSSNRDKYEPSPKHVNEISFSASQPNSSSTTTSTPNASPSPVFTSDARSHVEAPTKNTGTLDEETPSHWPHSRTPSPFPAPTSPISPTSMAARQICSTDISPYLSRLSEIPTSAKRLRQLSLLESIAEEAARMAARAAMVNRDSSGPFIPPPSPVATQTIFHQEPSVVPSYPPPGPPLSAAGFRHVVGDANGFTEPFQVRSRTSQAFHRIPLHNPTGSVTLHQNTLNNHLLYMTGSQYLTHHRAHPTPMFNDNSQYRYPLQTEEPPLAANNHNSVPTNVHPYRFPSQNFPTPNTTIGPSNSQNASLSLLSILNERPNQVKQ